MGNPRGFLTTERAKEREAPVDERVQHYREFSEKPAKEELEAQAGRCMDCGIPFCHQGCPLGNLIPEWNDLVYRGRMDEAARSLLSTNNFPEITGRVCPAPCEASCTLNIDESPVTIKLVEKSIAAHIFEHAMDPCPAAQKSGKRVAVVGSGPAGLAAAQQLARAGHDVTVFERDDRIGGLLRYGIPDFKLEKHVIDRRLAQMEAEGVVFKTGVNVGVDVDGDALRRDFDAVLLAGGARAPRDLPVPGRELSGIHFAMTFLTQSNKRVAGDAIPESEALLATDKHVVVIGGGDTGSDCVGTSIRHRAKSVVQLELLPKPPLARMPQNPWPEWPLVLRTSSSQEEGCERDWAVMTKGFVGEAGHVTALRAVRVQREGFSFKEVPGTEFELPADLVLLAMGFVGPEKAGLVEQLGLSLDARGNVVTTATGATNVPGVFAAGDMSRGQSLVVWAIADGRRVAAGVDAHLRTAARAPHAA
jgi:glutamate synthase (NADPH/NADH) small chain